LSRCATRAVRIRLADLFRFEPKLSAVSVSRAARVIECCERSFARNWQLYPPCDRRRLSLAAVLRLANYIRMPLSVSARGLTSNVVRRISSRASSLARIGRAVRPAPNRKPWSLGSLTSAPIVAWARSPRRCRMSRHFKSKLSKIIRAWLACLRDLRSIAALYSIFLANPSLTWVPSKSLGLHTTR
jgi:hypothetical protein